MEEDLNKTDQIAATVIENLLKTADLNFQIKQQYQDNLEWIKKAKEHCLIVGTKARILYADQKGRVDIALAFNDAIKKKQLKVHIKTLQKLFS